MRTKHGSAARWSMRAHFWQLPIWPPWKKVAKCIAEGEGSQRSATRGREIDEWLERGRKREEAVMICCLLHYCTDRYKWSLMLAETTEGKGKPTMYYTAHEVNKAYEYVRTAEVISRCKRVPISVIPRLRTHLLYNVEGRGIAYTRWQIASYRRFCRMFFWEIPLAWLGCKAVGSRAGTHKLKYQKTFNITYFTRHFVRWCHARKTYLIPDDARARPCRHPPHHAPRRPSR